MSLVNSNIPSVLKSGRSTEFANHNGPSGVKDEDPYNPGGLLARSMRSDGQGIIYVAINYRLGIFGWLNGYGDNDVLPNVGLHDQRLALDW